MMRDDRRHFISKKLFSAIRDVPLRSRRSSYALLGLAVLPPAASRSMRARASSARARASSALFVGVAGGHPLGDGRLAHALVRHFQGGGDRTEPVVLRHPVEFAVGDVVEDRRGGLLAGLWVYCAASELAVGGPALMLGVDHVAQRGGLLWHSPFSS